MRQKLINKPALKDEFAIVFDVNRIGNYYYNNVL